MRNGNSILAARDLCVTYDNVPALNGISLDVHAGEVVALVGPNGAGKSTLLRAISGVQLIKSGSLSFEGKTLKGRAAHEIARMGLLHTPESREIFGNLTTWENLKVAFDNLNGEGEDEEFERIFQIFPVLKQRLNSLAGNLSGGQQQMLAIARSLLGKPKLLMLDEPSLGLAQIIVKDIYAALEKLSAANLTILLVEQHAHMAMQFADYTYVMVNGRFVLQDTRENMRGGVQKDVIDSYMGARS